jgi:hypothetical protein
VDLLTTGVDFLVTGVMALGEQGFGEVGADEAGYAGDEVGGHCGEFSVLT